MFTTTHTMRKRLTQDVVDKAIELRRRGWGWKDVRKTLGFTVSSFVAWPTWPKITQPNGKRVRARRNHRKVIASALAQTRQRQRRRRATSMPTERTMAGKDYIVVLISPTHTKRLRVSTSTYIRIWELCDA